MKDKRLWILVVIIGIFCISGCAQKQEELGESIANCENSIKTGQCYRRAFCGSKMPSDINKALEVCDNIDYPLVNCYTEIARQYDEEKHTEICEKLEYRLINEFGENKEIEYVEVLSCDSTVSRELRRMNVGQSKEFCLNH
jgi:hypothetical protein